MRHTRIIATVGPACDAPDTLKRLIGAGVDVFRLNFSHGSHETHAATITRIREAAAHANRMVAVLQDLWGRRFGPVHFTAVCQFRCGQASGSES